MDMAALHLAADLGGSVLSGEGGALVLVERQRGHGLPALLVLGTRASQVLEALEAWEASDAGLNLCALLPAPDAEVGVALRCHRRRIGSLVAALDVSLPWLDDRPMLAKRLPGRIFMASPEKLGKAPLSPLEKDELKSFLPDWDKQQRRRAFRRGPWAEVEGGFEADLWSGVAFPTGAELRVPPLELPTASALMELLRSSLRAASGQPVPLLPLPGDPSNLHALAQLTPAIAAFRGPVAAWRSAYQKLAALPAPPHFCARC
ncbi:MAG: hypothetical protein IPQ13_05490 [Holophagaceae bacterium]|nr:hypothetical protein [Holophagaceae bacterium]